jgi:pimeloyl-ACP methyl ester carboxylesterase
MMTTHRALLGWLRQPLRVVVPAVALFLAAACATPVGVDPIPPQDFERDLTASALSVDKPSRFSDQVLQRFNLSERFTTDPVGALAALRATLEAAGEENRLFALAELSYLHAEHARVRAYHFAAAAYAYAFLFRGEGQAAPDALDPRTRIAADIYNRAITQGLMAPARAEVIVAAGEKPLPFGRLDVALPGGPPVWAGRHLEGFLPAANVAVRGLRNRYRQAGLGAPLVAGLGPAVTVAPKFSLVPPRLKVPVTIFLRFDHVREGIASGQLHASLELYTMDAAARITVEGRQVPLEFEPSTALAYSLERAQVWESEIRGFLRGNYFQDGGGALYTLTPYRPGHVPVVLIHGTASSPARWADLVNELNADPQIAPRIQFWLFAYNTGNPILYSAGLLRETLIKTVAELDPQGTDAALHHMVLIGHSQGGLLAKLMVIDSGTRFWDNISEAPIQDLQVSAETRAVLQRSLFMTPLLFVDRVVFVATPHRGSSLAGLLIGRFRWLIDWALRLPPNILRMTGEVLTGSEDPLLRYRLQQGLPRSVNNMSPGHPTIQILASLPVAPGVTVNSIIAIKGGGRSLDEAGDGVVSYRSAHLDEAQSELIVESGHSVQGNPDAIEEIRRILIEQLATRSPDTAG